MYLVKNPVTYCIYLKPICACFTSNIFGLRPVDYAETEEIKLALLQAQKNKEPLAKPPCSAVSKTNLQDCQKFCLPLMEHRSAIVLLFDIYLFFILLPIFF